MSERSPRPESALDQFVSCVEIAAKIMWKENEADDDPADDISDYDLQKREVGVVRESGNADDGEGAGFGRHDGQGNGPPRNFASGKKIIAKCSLLLAEAQAKQRDAC